MIEVRELNFLGAIGCGGGGDKKIQGWFLRVWKQ